MQASGVPKERWSAQEHEVADDNEKEPIDADEETEETAESAESEEAESEEAGGDELSSDDVDEDADDDDADSDDADSDDDDEESDDEEAAEAAASSKKAAAAKAAAAAVAKRKKTGRKKKKPKQTSGQRLAKAKKAKAERKAAERGREDELAEESAIEQAEVAATFLEKNQKSIVMGMIGIAVAAALYFGYQKFSEGAVAESSAALWAAVGTANAEVVAEEDAPADSDAPERETYETIGARAEAALEKFRAVQAEFPGSGAAVYAALGEANALYDTGEYADSREVYERALSSSDGDVNIELRATEGVAFTYEAEDNWESAKERYEELKDVDHPQAEPLARFHLARVALHNEDEETAKTELQTLLENLREEDAPQLPYVRDQAELRLLALDSSLVQRAPDLGGLQGLGGPGSSQEDLQRQIEELMRQQQEQGGQ